MFYNVLLCAAALDSSAFLDGTEVWLKDEMVENYLQVMRSYESLYVSWKLEGDQ